MTTFQIITLPLMVVAVLITSAAMSRRRLTKRAGVAWLALWIAAAVSIADPDLLARMARFLGIGRGADLVLYISILTTFGAFFLVYLRFRRLDEQLTEIIRHLAIRDAVAGASEESGGRASGGGLESTGRPDPSRRPG